MERFYLAAQKIRCCTSSEMNLLSKTTGTNYRLLVLVFKDPLRNNPPTNRIKDWNSWLPIELIFIINFPQFRQSNKIRGENNRIYLKLEKWIRSWEAKVTKICVIYGQSQSWQMPPKVCHICDIIFLTNAKLKQLLRNMNQFWIIEFWIYK